MRKKRNRIFKVKDRDGTWIEDEKLLNEHFIDEYKKRFKSQVYHRRSIELKEFSNCITMDENRELTKEVSSDEIKEAFWQIEAPKALGPDRFEAAFFHKY